MQGFVSFQVSEMSSVIKLTLKLTGLRCLEYSIWLDVFKLIPILDLRPTNIV